MSRKKRKKKDRAPRRGRKDPNIIMIRDLIPDVMPKAPTKTEEPK